MDEIFSKIQKIEKPKIGKSISLNETNLKNNTTSLNNLFNNKLKKVKRK